MAWSDDFNYADGPLGAPWGSFFGILQVANNEIKGAGGIGVHSILSSPGAASATITLGSAGSGIMKGGPLIKATADGANGYTFRLNDYGSYYYYQIRKLVNGGYLNLYFDYVYAVLPPGSTLGISYNAGTITVYVNGVAGPSVNDSQHDTNDRLGFVYDGETTGITRFETSASILNRSINVTPDPFWVGGGRSLMSCEGTDTTWTPGTPGSSTITASHGTIDAQICDDATHIRFDFTPDEYVGPITFTESEYSLQDTINAVAIKPEGYPGGVSGCCIDPLTADALDAAIFGGNPHFYASNTDIGVPGLQYSYAEWIKLVYDFVNTYGGGGNGGISPAIADLRKILNGGAVPPTGSWLDELPIPIHQMINSLDMHLNDLRTPENRTLLTVINAIRGLNDRDLSELYVGVMGAEPRPFTSVMDGLDRIRNVGHDSIANIASQMDLLTNAGTQDIDTILTAISGIGGGGGPGTQAIIDLLNDIRNGDDVNLKYISDWVAANGQSLYDLLDKMNLLTSTDTISLQSILDAVGGAGGLDLTPVLTAISNLRGDNASTVKAIQDSLSAYRTGANYTVQHILDAINRTPAGSDWTTPALGLLLLLLLLGLGAPEAVAVAAGGAGAAGIIALIIAALPDTVAAMGAIWEWWRRASEWRSVPTVPAFPGIDRVEWLPPVHFQDATRVVGPMDGAVIRVTTPGKAPYAITMGEETRYARLGVFAFQSEETAYEHIQPIQFLSQLATPKAMDTAIAILVQCKPGTEGSVTPYRLTYPGPWPFQGIHLPL